MFHVDPPPYIGRGFPFPDISPLPIWGIQPVITARQTKGKTVYEIDASKSEKSSQKELDLLNRLKTQHLGKIWLVEGGGDIPKYKCVMFFYNCGQLFFGNYENLTKLINY